jgi:low temperature requirement protein LtrA
VTALELFFDVVFVLAITQCTAYMADHPTWTGLTQGVLILAVLWWGWVGYSWLTSVVDPEEGWVRIAMFGAMAALLVVSLAIPEAFDELGLLFAAAYAVFRSGQLILFWIASADEPELRNSIAGFGVSTIFGVGMLIIASQLDGTAQIVVFALAISLDVLGPYVRGSSGWQLIPQHFAERHRLILIIALGESIVAIGAGAEHGVGGGEVLAAVLGTGVAACIWWIYFDVVALVTETRLVRAASGREQNEMARDVYSYLHFPMVAGIVLVALGLKKTLGGWDEHLYAETAAALFGGAALYLLAHVAVRLRNVHTVSTVRLGLAILLLVAIPLVTEIAATAAVAILLAALILLIAYETHLYGDTRSRVRHEHWDPQAR